MESHVKKVSGVASTKNRALATDGPTEAICQECQPLDPVVRYARARRAIRKALSILGEKRCDAAGRAAAALYAACVDLDTMEPARPIPCADPGCIGCQDAPEGNHCDHAARSRAVSQHSRARVERG
jgi:hypothetical protein